jgi:transcriptional regulator with XRE-family HTH domain
MSMKLRDKLLNEREELVVRLREEEKLTLQEIGERLGVSRERVRQIHINARIKLKDFAENGEAALSLLPMRARRVVEELKIGSHARARAAMESGRLACSWGGHAIFWDGAMLRQLSRKTWAALYEWAGSPVMPLRPDFNLPERVRQLVVKLKIDSRASARAAIESGQLSWNKGFACVSWEGNILRNMGRKTWAVLYEWAGRPALPPNPQSP